MATVSESQASGWTASDVIAHFGDIPIARLLTSPRPGEATEADVIELHDHHDRLCELIDGTLVEKTMGWRESDLALWIGTLLNQFVRPRKLGKVFGSDGMLRLEPGQVRIPDVSFVSKQRFAGRTVTPSAFWELGCDLAIEVISPSNTHREMERKVDDYFRAGVQLVWLVYPDTRQVAVYTSATQLTTIDQTGVLEGGSLLPGFSIPLTELFAELDEADEPGN